MLFEASIRKIMEKSKTIVIACATVVEEMTPLLPPDVGCEVLDFGLHINPDELRSSLQKAINRVGPGIKNIVLGYGLCSKAVIGLKSETAKLVVPLTDDCIAIFLGSKSRYAEEQRAVPGTYYLTKGWIIAGSTPFDEFNNMKLKYGDEKAHRIMDKMLKNYKRLAFINTGDSDLAVYHAKAQDIAGKFKLKYEEIQGSAFLVKKMISGPWDDDFLVTEPGQTIQFGDFFKSGNP
jgi:hypothetical protein